MTVETVNEELEAAIAAAELTTEQAARARELVEEGAKLETAVALAAGETTAQGNGEETEAPPAPANGEPTREQLTKLQAELTRHEKTVEKIMGPLVAGFVACDTCGGVGMVPPDLGPPPHRYFKACDVCNGWARVATGSKEPNNAFRPCPNCRGRGYLELIGPDGAPVATDQLPGAAAAAPPPSVEPAPAEASSELPAAEPTFGTPSWMGDPNLGA